jgi:C4-dicarboxylate transporter
VGSSRAWSGWIGFAGLMMMVIGSLDFFEGLIAVIRKGYYVATPNQIIVFDTTTWGWITMLLGVLLVLVGLGLTTGSGAARWTAIVILVLNLLAQLAWLGNTVYPLWTLTVITLEIIVLYALTARWHDAVAEPV